MKQFKEYLTEAKKTYPFKIGVAGDLADDFESKMKACLEKFEVSNCSAGKKTPIQERPLDFPQLENMEVTYWECELGYPTTTLILQEYIEQCCACQPGYVIVRSPGEAQEAYQEQVEEKTYEPMLTTEELEGESAQDQVGEKRIMDLLKELETARKEKQEGNAHKAEPVKEEPQNTESVIGG